MLDVDRIRLMRLAQSWAFCVSGGGVDREAAYAGDRIKIDTRVF